MKVVIDSNILFRTLISQGDILKLIFHSDLELFAPLKLKEELNKNKQEILSKSGINEKRFDLLVSLILKRITFIPLEKYSKYLKKAKLLIKNHPKDIDFIALCLSKNIKFWTYESRYFNEELNLAISTKQISTKLNSKI